MIVVQIHINLYIYINFILKWDDNFCARHWQYSMFQKWFLYIYIRATQLFTVHLSKPPLTLTLTLTTHIKIYAVLI